MSKNFLLELLCEEIPARMQKGAREQLQRAFSTALKEAGVKADSITVYSTPRRMVLLASGLPAETPATSEERKGPRADAPEKALAGFLRSVGLTRDQLEEREDKKGNKILFAVMNHPGRKMTDILAEAIGDIIKNFNWPKSMRWGAASMSSDSLRWVRPLQGIVALLGDDIVPVALDGVAVGRNTKGHRFHHQGDVTIAHADDYLEAMRNAHVLVNHEEREAIIRDGAAKAAAEAGLELVADEGLVVENAGLTEWPVPLLGRYDEEFLTVPEEVIQLSARVNQKYFICRDGAGELAPAFICTGNIDAHDGGKAIVAGNEKVLAARLSDARFFWELDQKKPLAEHAQKLEKIVFHEKLGTLADKVERVARLARWLVEEDIVTPGMNTPSPSAADAAPPSPAGGEGKKGRHAELVSASPVNKTQLADMAEQAARLCKADLVTEMVGEFPELQGVMGGYYARAESLPDAVAEAICDHYKPVGQNDDVPTAPVTIAVSLADKLDTLVSFFAIDEKPTGSKDPFALRRSQLGIIKLILDNNIRTSLRHHIKDAARLIAKFNRNYYEANRKKVSESLGHMESQIGEKLSNEQYDNLNRSSSYEAYLASYDDTTKVNLLINELFAFAIDRLKVQQKEAGVRHDLIDAVFALGGEDDLVRLLARVKALQGFVESDEGANLLAGYKRAANILKKEKPSPPAGEGGEPKASRERGQVSGDDPTPNPSPKEEGLHSATPDIRTSTGSARTGVPSPEQGSEPDEIALAKALSDTSPKVTAALKAEDFTGAMAVLANLRAPIDGFFDNVTVNDDDPEKRAYRLGLLHNIITAMHEVADFSKVEG